MSSSKIYKCFTCGKYYFQDKKPKKCDLCNGPDTHIIMTPYEGDVTSGQVALMMQLNKEKYEQQRLREQQTIEMQPAYNTQFFVREKEDGSVRLTDENRLIGKTAQELEISKKMVRGHEKGWCIACGQFVHQVPENNKCPYCKIVWFPIGTAYSDYDDIAYSKWYEFEMVPDVKNFLFHLITYHINWYAPTMKQILVKQAMANESTEVVNKAMNFYAKEDWRNVTQATLNQGVEKYNLSIKSCIEVVKIRTHAYEITFADKLQGILALIVQNGGLSQAHYDKIITLMSQANNLSDRHKKYLEEEKEFVGRHIQKMIYTDIPPRTRKKIIAQGEIHEEIVNKRDTRFD